MVSLAGGLMFGTLAGGVIIVISATLGASGLFVAARYIIGDTLRARAGPALQKFEAAFNRDAWSYMLVLRLLPIFPFFIVNLGAALVGVRFPIFLLTTFSALCRGLLFCLHRQWLSGLLQAGQRPDLSVMQSPEIWGRLSHWRFCHWHRFYGALEGDEKWPSILIPIFALLAAARAACLLPPVRHKWAHKWFWSKVIKWVAIAELWLCAVKGAARRS